MSEVVSREVHLVSRPDGMPVAEVAKRLAWSKGEIPVRNLYMSIDPAMRPPLSNG